VKTIRLVVNPDHLEARDSRQAIAQAAKIIRQGGLVALPTETVYGLGANALDAAAVARIFSAKGRPAWDPVIVHIAGPPTANSLLNTLVTDVPERARELISAFWPGPLTLLLQRSGSVPDIVTAGRPLVGIRMPTHPVAVRLIGEAAVPVAAPSANLFGHISPTSADHVLDDLDGRIDAVLDAGPTEHGVESTVLDPNQSPMMIYRPGAITAEQICKVGGPVRHYQSDDASPISSDGVAGALPSPGAGIRHYAPRAKLILIDAPFESLGELIAAEVRRHSGSDPVGVLLPAEISPSDIAADGGNVIVCRWGSWKMPADLAGRLYSILRDLDKRGCSTILCPMPPPEGVGLAIRDRLSKAAR
jgi:L-threonylcarbamoyladenylate synthase